MKLTKRHLQKIIKEEKRRLLSEAVYVHDIMMKAATALEMRDGEKLDRLIVEIEQLMMSPDDRNSYMAVLNAMAEAAYELEAYEESM